MVSFFDFFLRSEKIKNDIIMDGFDNTSGFSREIPDLDEDIFFLLRIEDASIEIFQNEKIFIEPFSIVLLEVGIHDESSLFDEESTLFTIDELSDMFFSFCRFHEGEPYRIRLSMHIRDNLYTLTILEDIVEGDDLPIHFCNCELIAELRMDRISEIYGCGTLGQCDNISLRREDKNLVRKNIHSHLTHEFLSLNSILNNSLDGLYPVAILRLG